MSTPIPVHPFSVEGVAFLHDGQSLVTVGQDQTLRIIDRHSGHERLLLDEAPHIFESVAVSPDDRIIAAGCRDGTVLVYRAVPE